MTWPTHNRFVVRGQFGTTKEIWSNTLHFPSDITAGPDVHPQDWDESAITSAVNAFYGANIFGDGTKVTGWRGYTIGSDGRYTGDNIKVVEYDTPVAGSGTTRFPPQVAIVLSLWADNRGPAQHGRIYLPGPNTSISATLQETSAVEAGAYLTAFKTYVEALLDAMYPSLDVGEGLANVSKVGTGTIQHVTQYRCGLVLDTIRDRRNKLVENYQVLDA